MDFRGFIEEIKAILNIQQNPLKNTKFANQTKRCFGRVARQWSATPSTAVRIR